ncbi:MAG: NERD domain-containing protein [Bacteroidaceae bacterium]|nr:NERD domain-containing protein [Bacteroidaceae bacterium]
MQSAVHLLIIFVVITLFILLARYDFSSQKGKRGEMRVSSILSQLPEEYTILNDLVYRTEKGTTQIDHVVVSKYGIFAIETKNYRGEIYGDDDRKEWTQLIVTKVKYPKKWWKTYTYVTKSQFYNPVRQSFGHALKIKELLSAFPHLKVVPIVVFVGEAVLKNVKSRQHVVYEEGLLSVINMYKTTYLSNDDVKTVLSIIEANNVRETVSNRQHIKNLQAAAKEVHDTIKSGICPKCGGNLVVRKGKFGTFYGCSNYPECKYTIQ